MTSALSLRFAGLVSRVKRQCFRLIRKIPFVGVSVSAAQQIRSDSASAAEGGADLWHAVTSVRLCTLLEVACGPHAALSPQIQRQLNKALDDMSHSLCTLKEGMTYTTKLPPKGLSQGQVMDKIKEYQTLSKCGRPQSGGGLVEVQKLKQAVVFR